MKPKSCLVTLVLIAVMLFVTLQKGNGFILVFLLLPFLVNLAYNAFKIWRQPAERNRRCARLAAWGIAFAVAGSFHAYRSTAARGQADLALDKVAGYKAYGGKYPAALRDVGLDDELLRRKWGIRYSINDGKPALSYPAALMPISRHEYDFDAGSWRLNAH